MKFFALLAAFSFTLFASTECVSCHQEQTASMVSECTVCHMDTKQHLKNNLQKTTLTAPADQPIIFSFQGLLQKDYGSKEFLHLKGDIHFEKGMSCVDCHTSTELHSNDFYSGKIASAIKCQDCHGTIGEYPWEIEELKDHNHTNIIRDNKEVVVYLHSGKQLTLKPLKLLKETGEISSNALIAMEQIDGHREYLSCSSCHALWAPQYFGTRINKGSYTSVFTRWEEPFLAQNKERKIAPAIPKTSPGKNTNLLKPIAPHTIQTQTRSCESCHSSAKVLEGQVGEDMFLEKNVSRFNVSKLLTSAQLDKLDRRGVCLSCHDTIPDGNLAISTISHMTEMLEVKADENKHKAVFDRILYMSEWFGVLTILFVGAITVYIIYTIFIKKKSINPRNRGWK